MLTDLERTYLEHRDSLEDDRQKKNLNHRIKNKLNLINGNLNDVKLILENYPEELVKEHISNNTIYAIAATLERALQILDPWPIGKHEDGGVRAFRVWGSATPTSKSDECAIHSISRGVTEEEIVFHERLEEHFEKIRFYVDPCVPDPVCRDPGYIRIQSDNTFQTAKDIQKITGNPQSISLDAYIDETGVNNEGWVLRSPTFIKIEQLQKMRWKPRGLVACKELPPVLREKKIPTLPGFLLRMTHDKNGTTYTLEEEGKKRILTKEEYEEASKRLKTRTAKETAS